MTRRGDILTVAAPGDCGKPRPAVVIQGDALNQAEPRSTIVALMTNALQDAPLLRVTVEPTSHNGLRIASQGAGESNRYVARNEGQFANWPVDGPTTG
jgi:mRNA interferase MazF